jgi:peptidylprolyl isomerase
MRILLCAALAATILGASAACSPGPDNSGYRPPRPAPSPTPTVAIVQVPIPPLAERPITMPNGLQYIQMMEGNGDIPRSGQLVRVHYTGWLTSTGVKFDSSYDRNSTFSFTLGKGEVIRGWEEGVAMMRVGEKRRLIIPPELAYGAQGNRTIPPNSSLTFDVELITVEG